MSVDEFDEQLLLGGLGSLCAQRVDLLLRDFFVTHAVVCGRPEQSHVRALKEAAEGLDVSLHLVDVADSAGEDLTSHFDGASRFLEKAVEEDDMNRILVCCREGASRSVSVLVAHLMRTRQMGLRQAFDAVAAKRWRLWPNMGFMQQLLRYRQVDDRDAVLAHLAAHAVWATAKHNAKALSKEEALAAWHRAEGDEPTRLENAKLEVLGVGGMKKPAPPDVTEVEPGLLIGGLGDKDEAELQRLLKEHGVRRLVICGNLQNDTQVELCKKVAGDDIEVHVCALPQPDDLAEREPAELERAVAFVQAGAPKQQPTLVACSKGASRSVSVVLTVLMLRRNLSLRQAFDLLASKRWRLWPNWRLVQHLIARDTGDQAADSSWRHIGAYAAVATCWHNGRPAKLEECYAAWDRRLGEAALTPEKRFLAVKEDVMGVGDLDSYELVERPEKRPKLTP
eukprot:TRINITY_DN49385_c0_g1_i1.p2 TRINITY_DN49385_c0_g1~~TRINITY_DN49385_c0_g1_i1.p2  ORF type:complete len:452 (-),score=144.87 TRINITY_DN49385_c0_g1_i1:1-1356(-)